MALRPINVLSLCAGIGGLDLGLRLVYGERARTVCFVERELHAAGVLAARMQDGALPHAPIWSDVKTFDAVQWRDCIDVVVAGYPCQPFSVAGRRAGKDDPRHLWPYIVDILRDTRAPVLFAENVPGHLTLGFEQVCHDLSAMGYGVEAGLFSAAELGAPHLRQRLFFVAHAVGESDRRQLNATRKGRRQASIFAYGDGEDGAVADAQCQRGTAEPGCLDAQERKAEGQGRECADQPGRSGEAVADANATFGRQPGAAGQQMDRTDYGLSAGRDQGLSKSCQRGAPMADAHSEGQLQPRGPIPQEQRRPCDRSDLVHESVHDGAIEPGLDRAVDGLSSGLVEHEQIWVADWEQGVPRVTSNSLERIDRLRALGNAVVPQVAAHAWRALSGPLQ